MRKEVKVKFLDEGLEREYLGLEKDDFLRRKIDGVIERLKENPSFGQPIAKRLIPSEYLKRGIKNAFWVELSKGRGWRLIYSLAGNEIDIIAIILEWFTRHKDYERRFGYN
jgi:hypothetical protein